VSDRLRQERNAAAAAIVEKHQWLAAASVFASPVPLLDLAAGGAIQYPMVVELAKAYGEELSPGQARALLSQMLGELAKLGLVESATSLVAGLFKTSMVGYAAGGAIQAVTIAYLTRIAGRAFAEYFAQGQSWGRGGISACLLRQFETTHRGEFLQQFAKQALTGLARGAVSHAAGSQAPLPPIR
jgi:uncharacterized protein (DUF697 family)